MNLLELVRRHPNRPSSSVPDWMLGYFKRRAISFANGRTDTATQVCWLQSRNFTIDLRLPLERDQVPARALADYSPDELQILANHEGWEALSHWDGKALSWSDDTSLQLHNRWPEPALLSRIGNCMIEFAPSGAYVEDWRLQPSAPGPLIGLRLIEERDLASGALLHRGGGLIVCGEHAALVLGRPGPIAHDGLDLRDQVARAVGVPERLEALFDFETSVAHGSLEAGFRVTLSTRPERVGAPLLALEGFSYLAEQQQVRQRFERDGRDCERLFSIDTLEPTLAYPQTTEFSADAHAWFERESATLNRYTQSLI
ncbi:hypothetical protein [Stutzerimonas tarimensis]|uniref:Uncharacterized protein n=1 Tax=Stutzerimonas tarimensis TaxID=1507735 RepID=A0ABV7TBT2_9GAMM